MRKTELRAGERYAVLSSTAERSRNRTPDPLDITCYEIVELNAPSPHSDERLTRVSTQWHSAEKLDAEDPAERPTGTLVRGINNDGHLEGPPRWYDSAKLFMYTWDTWLDIQAGQHYPRLRALLREAGDTPVTVGYSEHARRGPMGRVEPTTHAQPLTLDAVNVELAEYPTLGRVPVNPDTRGALVTNTAGQQLWVADLHHLCENPEQQNRRLDAHSTREERRAALRMVCEAQAMELRLGRWAPSGNRYRDQPGWNERDPDEPLPDDAGWLTYRPGFDADTISIGLEAFIELLAADDVTRSRFAEQVAAAMTGTVLSAEL